MISHACKHGHGAAPVMVNGTCMIKGRHLCKVYSSPLYMQEHLFISEDSLKLLLIILILDCKISKFLKLCAQKCS